MKPTFRSTRSPSSESPVQSKPYTCANPTVSRGPWSKVSRVPAQLSRLAATTPYTCSSSKRHWSEVFYYGLQIWLSRDASRIPNFRGPTEPEHGRLPSGFHEAGVPYTGLRRARWARMIPLGERLADIGRCVCLCLNRRAWIGVLSRPRDQRRASSRRPPVRRFLRSLGAAMSGTGPSAWTPGTALETKSPVKVNAPGPEVCVRHAATAHKRTVSLRYEAVPSKSPTVASKHGSMFPRPTLPTSTDPHHCSCLSMAARGRRTSNLLDFLTPQSLPRPLPRST